MTKKASGRTEPWEKVIEGEPASKANSRQLIWRGRKPMFIKSQKALDYLYMFNIQCPVLKPMFEGDIGVEMTLHYANRRSDLDESLILDALQGRVYRNDRQVKRKNIRWALDADRPRSFIRVYPLAGGAGTSDP